MTTDEAIGWLNERIESPNYDRGDANARIRVVLAELATLRENAGRLADAASPFLLNRHRHEKSNNGDICYLCGEDIRHQCHYLAGESWPSQIEGLRAALAPFAERKETTDRR